MSITPPIAHHTRPRRRVAVAIVVVVATMITWAAAASAAKASGPANRSRLATPLVSPTAAEVAAVMAPASPGDPLSELVRALMSQFPNTFGGLFVRDGQFVIATDGPASFALRVRASLGFANASRVFGDHSGRVPSVGFTYANTRVSLRRLYELKAAVLDNPVLRKDGIDGAGLDVEHGRVVVMSHTRAGARAVKADYGKAVEVLIDSGSGLTDGRYDDSAPWNGGDQIVTPSFGETTCTSGLGMSDTSTGQTYLLTAGHCGKATWYNTRTDDPVYDSSTLIGTTLTGSVSTDKIDAQLIATSSSCISWGDKSTKSSNDSRIYITGYTDPPQGAAIETEGSVSLEETGMVSYYDVSKTIKNEDLQDLDLVTAVGVDGDSGAPLIYPSIFGPLAGGTEVGWYASGSSSWGVFQLIDSETYTYTLMAGHQIVPNTANAPGSC